MVALQTFAEAVKWEPVSGVIGRLLRHDSGL
jgi:hypothetical protein